MLPEAIIEFVERAAVAVAATRDHDLVPHVHRVAGWALDPRRETLACGVSRSFTDGLVERVEENGRVAVTLEIIRTHETYQFKGEYLDARPATPDDRALAARCTQRFVEQVTELYGGAFPPEALERHVREPELVLRLRVREIFVQTPGPAAGQRIFPRGEG